MASRTRYKIDFAVLLAVLIIGFFAAKNAVAIGDWWFLSRYSPSAEIVRLADDAGMNEKGRKLFYRFSPEIVDLEAMRQYCGEKLGCVEGQNLYILQSSNQAEYNRSVVTAGHEMLHIAYSRLDESEKLKLHDLLQERLEGAGSNAVKLQLEPFTGEEYLNEAHSYIGTEINQLQPSLESHYSRYFEDRTKIIEAFRQSPEG